MALTSLYDVATELRDGGDGCCAAALYMAWGSLNRVAAPVGQEREPDVEVRLDGDGAVDEIVGTGFLHMEHLDDDVWWFSLTPAGKHGMHPRLAWTVCRNRVTVTEELPGMCSPGFTDAPHVATEHTGGET
jgi:hypothetical protein